MMRIGLKQTIAFLGVLGLCLACSTGALAERIFGDDFAAACQLSSKDDYDGISIAVVQNTVYLLMQNGDIYTWNSQTNTYAHYAHVPESPMFDLEVSLSRQSDEIKSKIAEAVTHLVPTMDGIYGFNDYTGAIGAIDADGIRLLDVNLDVSVLRPKGNDYPWEIQSAFIEDGKLYAYFNMGLISSQKAGPSLLTYDLATGESSHIDIPNTIAFCRYTPRKLLFLQDSGTETPALAVYEIASRQLTDLNLAVPISIPRKTFAKPWDVRSSIGGLAYDAPHDIIYLADTKGLWCSVAGAPFERKTTDSTSEPLNPLGEAWVLASGGYVSRVGFWWPDYVKP